MPTYAMAIDIRACIGCHACTVACKSEHDIPIGVWRCWVKNVEKGVFPSVRREFLPVLCNQCEDAPCLNICPTGALFRRGDGIVDVNTSVCIACKACMVACPYNQIFLDPYTLTAEKCNFCANRLERSLEPACVVVCPTQCRIFGDLEDPASLLGRLIQREAVQVRKPEKGTRPKIFYVEADKDAIVPTLPARPSLHMQGVGENDLRPGWEEPRRPGAPRVVYDAFHKVPWGNKIVAYLMTKGLSTGLFVLSLVVWKPAQSAESLFTLWAPLLSGLFLAATGLLLTLDLGQPLRFHYILLRPNWGSWMAWGAYFLTLFGALLALWVLGALVGAEGLLAVLFWPGLALGTLTSVYTGFFFAQASAQDLWQGPECTLDIAALSTVKGAGALLLLGLPFGLSPWAATFLTWALGGALWIHLAILLAANLLHRSPSLAHEQAVALIVRGPFKWHFWGGALAGGTVAPLALLTLAGGPGGAALAGALALAGAWAWDHIWVRAGQAIPLS